VQAQVQVQRGIARSVEMNLNLNLLLNLASEPALLLNLPPEPVLPRPAPMRRSAREKRPFVAVQVRVATVGRPMTPSRSWIPRAGSAVRAALAAAVLVAFALVPQRAEATCGGNASPATGRV